jgi:uncharacterized protein (TIGR02594 family)
MKEPVWLSVARAFVGLTEHIGKGSNPLIMQWVRDLKAPAWYDDDDKAWCAIFPNRIFLALGMPLSGSGFDLLRALTFRNWGQETLKPVPGTVLVFVRPSGGHVGFYVAETEKHYQVLGANQSNKVNLTWIAKSRLVAARWPPNVPMVGEPIVLQDTGDVSENEA